MAYTDGRSGSERENGQVEAFAAFLSGLLAAGLTVLALLGAGWLMNAGELTSPSRPWFPTALKALVVAVWPATTVLVYLRLKRRRERP
ncbi:hypothetical protein ATKI12_1306 [Kitasatospora sp. Ki12]|uniref:hypothetical protein n=1 Tax=Kitasatospora xanthocidica TaxID=83382 RepID=UPI0016728B7C|nr:hypothetical protein [Kitasatospora xanthocidica]GHF64867.1 hypothetical protein GCM10018790_48400 [Kitasatospora xanthocidica]